MSQTFKIVDGDWVFGATGRPDMVTGSAKTNQDIEEDLAIEVQPNGFGAGLDRLIGQAVDQGEFQMVVATQIRSSIVAVQRLQARFLRDQRPASERITGVRGLQVFPTKTTDGRGDKVTYGFRLVVGTQGQDVVLTRVVA